MSASYLFPILLTTLALVFYQLCQKSIPARVSPFVSLSATYFTALVGTLIMLLIDKGSGNEKVVWNLNWTSFALGLTCIGIDIGFLLTYRAGWNISMASLSTGTLSLAILIVVGVFFYQESVSAINAVGMFLALTGLVLMQVKA